jgi:hypothetical protein
MKEEENTEVAAVVSVTKATATLVNVTGAVAAAAVATRGWLKSSIEQPRTKTLGSGDNRSSGEQQKYRKGDRGQRVKTMKCQSQETRDPSHWKSFRKLSSLESQGSQHLKSKTYSMNHC